MILKILLMQILQFCIKKNLANLKTEVDKLDIDKLATVPVDLSKLSNVVENDVVKKTVYEKLVARVDNIDTSGLVKKTDCNTKITEIEGKIPDISGLAKKTALTTVENKIPSISGLVKKKQTTRLRLLILKINSIIIIMINMLLLQNLIL